jgi:hypothetical protein
VHFQLVREFYTTADGLAGDEIHAVTVTPNGAVLVASKNGLTRRDGEQWVKESRPAEVTALFAPGQGPDAFAGAADGVWALENQTWEQEPGSPERVIAMAAEPDGTPWALAPSGVWRRADGWRLVHTIEDDWMSGVRDLLPTGPDDVLIAAETGLFKMMGKRKYWVPFEVRPGGLQSADTRALGRLDREHFLVTTDRGLNLSNGTLGWHAFTGQEGLPIL